MLTAKTNLQGNRQRRGKSSRGLLLAIGTVAIALLLLAVWWSAGNSEVATGTSNALGSQVSANPSDTDIAGLQAAEKGTAGQAVLVWFHADW